MHKILVRLVLHDAHRALSLQHIRQQALPGTDLKHHPHVHVPDMDHFLPQLHLELTREWHDFLSQVLHHRCSCPVLPPLVHSRVVSKDGVVLVHGNLWHL